MKFKDGDKIKAEHFNEFAAKANPDLSNLSPIISHGQNRFTGNDICIEWQTGMTGQGYSDGWYRKYKSGWVEQGALYITPSAGTLSIVSFPIRMADTTYSVTFGSTPESSPGYNHKTTSTMSLVTARVIGSQGMPAKLSMEIRGMGCNK